MIETIGWDIPSDVVMAPIRRCIVRSLKRTVEVTGETLGLDGPIGMVVDRKRLDDWLLERAIGLGVEYVPGARVARLSRSARWTALSKDGRQFHGDFLVGADGPDGIVSQYAFGQPPLDDQDVFLGSEVYVRAPSFPNDAILLNFDTARIQGYHWAFSGGDIVKVGCGSTRSSGVNPSVENEWWRARLTDLYHDGGFLGSPVGRIGGRITGAKPLRRVLIAKRNAALVGEAARAVWASVGAGDAAAIETGRALGRALARDKMEEYRWWWRHNAYPYLLRHYWLKELILRLSNDQLGRALALAEEYRPTSTNPRREIPKLIRHVAARDPGLLVGTLATFAGRVFGAGA